MLSNSGISKDLKLNETSAELSSTYREDAHPAEPNLEGRPSQARQKRSQDAICWWQPRLDDVDMEILAILRKFPFSSIFTIADCLGTASPTIYFHLIGRIGF
jgi:hypothetical protein